MDLYRSPRKSATPKPRTPSPPPKSPSPPPVKPIETDYDRRQIRPLRNKEKIVLESESEIEERIVEEKEKEFRLHGNDHKELQVALEVFGSEALRGALHKNPTTKAEAAKDILQQLENYKQPESNLANEKPGKVMRGSTQILIRLVRDKVCLSFTCKISSRLH